jgi:hypothetical protein
MARIVAEAGSGGLVEIGGKGRKSQNEKRCGNS